MKRFAQNQLPALVWIGIIFWLSSLHRIPNIHIPMADKIAHFCFYFVLCGFSYRACFLQDRYQRLKRFAASSSGAFTILYGVTDEIHQISVWGRTPDVVDLSVDALGAVVFVVLLNVYQRHRTKTAASSGAQTTD